MAPQRQASIFNLFRFVTALATVLVSNGVMAAGAPAGDDVRHVLLLLAAAGEEYREGVQDGRVVRAVEVEEAGALVQEARSRWQRVSGAFPGHDLSRGFDELGQAVSETLLADDLVRKVAALRRQVSAVSGVAEAVRPPKVPSADRGQQLFSRYCMPCHGERGDGKGPSAAVLTPAPTDFTDPRFMRGGTPADFFNAISLGKRTSAMPAWDEVLSVQDRWDLVNYLWTLPAGELAATVDWAGMVEGPTSEAALTRCARLVDAGVAAYLGGGADAAASVTDAYMQFEPLESHIGATAPGLKERTEEHFLHLRQALRVPGSDAEVRRWAAMINEDLTAVRAALAPQTNSYALFAESATIILREGLEIVLVVGALMAYVMKTSHARMRRPIYAGVGLGVVASLVTAFLLRELLHLHPAASDVLEGLTMLLAAAVLFWVSYWLISKAEAAKWQSYIQGRVQTALSGGGGLALASAAFLAVYREGFETVLFYQALYASAPAASATVTAGLVAGTIALLVIYAVLRRLEIRIPIRQFFFVTGLFLYAMAAIFAGQGVHELQEAGAIGLTPVSGVPALPLLGLYPSAESLVAQAVFVTLLLYATGVTLRREARATA